MKTLDLITDKIQSLNIKEMRLEQLEYNGGEANYFFCDLVYEDGKKEEFSFQTMYQKERFAISRDFLSYNPNCKIEWGLCMTILRYSSESRFEKFVYIDGIISTYINMV